MGWSASSVDEGSSAIFEIIFFGEDGVGISLEYEFSGISASDIAEPLKGSVTTQPFGNDGRAFVQVSMIADGLTEGPETMTGTWRWPDGTTIASASITNNDTSRAQQREPVYSLMYEMTSVNEGQTAVFTLVTENVAAGTRVSYSLLGVQAEDIVGGQLTGSVTVDAQGRALISVPIAADNTTEGPETLTVRAQGVSASITINDTSVQGPTVFSQPQATG